MELNSVLKRNIEILRKKRAEDDHAATGRDKLAQFISTLTGSMTFVAVHAAILILWVTINLGLVPVLAPFDPTFVILATCASVEAFFLSTFIMISQNRAAVIADRRSDLDVQISLLTEHEVTRILSLCTEIAERLNIRNAQDPELDELKRDVAPEHVIDEIESSEREAARRGS
jgi:uncharacterized membrane protein